MSETFENVSVQEVKNFWDNRPCNIRHSPAPLATRQYFNEVEARKYLVEPHIPKFAEFSKWKGKKVLEIGCGIGTDTINFARAGAFVTAVDLSEISVSLAKKRAEVYGVSDQIEFYAGDAENLNTVVKPQIYDLIYSFGVIHHCPNPEKIIRQIKDHFVSKGTTLKLMLYNRHSWKSLQILINGGPKAWLNPQSWIARNSEAQSGCPVTYTYTRSSIKKLIGSEFKIKTLSVEHIFPFEIRAYKNYRYKKLWYFDLLPDAVFKRFEKFFGWHLCLTALVEK